jgi:hypothetical protein
MTQRATAIAVTFPGELRMKTLAASIVIYCMTIAALCAQDAGPPPLPTTEAKVVLKAQSSARVGEMVRFDASDSIADSFKWLLIPESDDFLTYDSGARAVFSARAPGKYRFVLAVAKDGTVDVIDHVVVVKGPPPNPATDSLSEWIPVWLYATSLPRDECEILAANFEALAARDDLTKPIDWINATQESNREILGDRIDEWAPILEKIGMALLKKAEAGLLDTPMDHARVWKEIAKGLRNGS